MVRRLPSFFVMAYGIGFQGGFVDDFCCLMSTRSPTLTDLWLAWWRLSWYVLFFSLAAVMLSRMIL